ncbi:MAG TPA: queuosine precursor transporter [Bacteroidales bacterium]|nr:queuosine precursor transporter [Bacteroidales bacterium]
MSTSKRVFSKENLLFILLGGFFLTNALLAEFIGVKIFSLERLFGFSPLNISIFGQENISFNLTAGVLLWPIVFIMTDVINEYFGRRGVRILSFLAVGMISYAFIMAYMAIEIPPADFWPNSHLERASNSASRTDLAGEVGNYNTAFRLIFGQGLWIIVGSLVAFLIGQFVDVWVFQNIRSFTGEKKVWLRATGSTLVSQFIDSFVVLIIAFYLGAGWDLALVLAIAVVNYFYKFTMAIALTPLIYLAHHLIDLFLGADLAADLKQQASNQPLDLNKLVE